MTIYPIEIRNLIIHLKRKYAKIVTHSDTITWNRKLILIRFKIPSFSYSILINMFTYCKMDIPSWLYDWKVDPLGVFNVRISLWINKNKKHL